MDVEIAYARQPNQAWLMPLVVEQGCSVEQAIVASGLLRLCAEINLAVNKVGIFSKIVGLDTVLQAGDRVEIYRALLLDPKAARRLRAQRLKPAR